MKLIKNLKALSTLSIIILLIASLILGAFLSYLMVMGYYFKLAASNPKNNTLTISRIDFSNQSTSYFNVTFFTPYYSPPPDARITLIAVKTADNKLHTVTQISPGIPYTIPKAQNITFKCTWDWANYTGQNIGVMAFIDGGSGPTLEARAPFVGFNIVEAHFNSSISVTHFNLTIQNSPTSETYVNISKIVVPNKTLLQAQVNQTLPYKLNINQNVTFKCDWDWTNYQNKSITIAVHTEQGYIAYYNMTTPEPLNAEITNLTFSETDMTHFYVTVRNRNESSSFIDINEITVTLENGTEREISGTQITPSIIPPYRLNRNSSETFKCPWDWTHYRGKNAKVSIFTTQNYTIQYTKTTQSPIEITSTIFDVADVSNFNVTVHNSALHYTSVNITRITLAFENGTAITEINGTNVRPALPYILDVGLSQPFRCPWNWTAYQGKNITITVRTVENQMAQSFKVIPKTITVTGITFDPINTTIFNITVRNSALSVESVTLTNITITFENGTRIEVSTAPPYPLPHTVSPNSTVTLTCLWNWDSTDYRGKTITITIYAEKGYTASSLYTIPLPQ